MHERGAPWDAGIPGVVWPGIHHGGYVQPGIHHGGYVQPGIPQGGYGRVYLRVVMAGYTTGVGREAGIPQVLVGRPVYHRVWEAGIPQGVGGWYTTVLHF